MKGADFFVSQHKNDVQNIVTNTSAYHAVAPFATGVISINSDTFWVGNNCFGVGCRKTVLFDMLEICLIPVKDDHSLSVLQMSIRKAVQTVVEV